MTDVATTPDRPKPKRSDGAAHGPVLLVSGNKLALHFGCARQHIDQLAQKGVIERRTDGLFDQDVARLKYLTHLRAEHKRSPRTEADAAHAKAKTELLQIRIEEKKRTLVRRDAVDELIDQIAGTVLTHLSGMSARCSRCPRRVKSAVLTVRRSLPVYPN